MRLTIQTIASFRLAVFQGERETERETESGLLRVVYAVAEVVIGCIYVQLHFAERTDVQRPAAQESCKMSGDACSAAPTCGPAVQSISIHETLYL